LVGMREVRGYRWVGLDQGHVTLQISAKRRAGLPGIEVDVQVREDVGAAPDLSPATLIMEGTMLFAEAYPDPPSIETLELKGERPSRWHGEILYTDGMFHGPAFQAVVGVDRTGQDGVEATLRVLPTDALFQSRPTPALVTDPVVLDAAGQVVGYWALENLTTRFNVFPFRLESLRIYRPNLVVDVAGDGWLEDTWCGHSTIRIGAVELRPQEPCVRCTMVTRPQPNLDGDPDIFRTLARNHGGHFGAWTAVTTGGTIRVGDEVCIEPR